MPLNNNSKYLLALHSSSEKLGVAILDLEDSSPRIKDLTIEAGRTLSNNLFSHIETLLPANRWKQIARIAVATGPGGFTGTRLTIAMTRALAQQLNCQLDGVSSFSLMAPRLLRRLDHVQINSSFWITKMLEKRGLIGGQYKIKSSNSNEGIIEVVELQEPHLLPLGVTVQPNLSCEENVKEDTKRLLRISLINHRDDVKSPWEKVLPIYPTSPVKCSR